MKQMCVSLLRFKILKSESLNSTQRKEEDRQSFATFDFRIAGT